MFSLCKLIMLTFYSKIFSEFDMKNYPSLLTDSYGPLILWVQIIYDLGVTQNRLGLLVSLGHGELSGGLGVCNVEILAQLSYSLVLAGEDATFMSFPECFCLINIVPSVYSSFYGYL